MAGERGGDGAGRLGPWQGRRRERDTTKLWQQPRRRRGSGGRSRATRTSFKPATGDDAATRSSPAEPQGDYREEARSGEAGPGGWRDKDGAGKAGWAGARALDRRRGAWALGPSAGTGARLRTARGRPSPRAALGWLLPASPQVPWEPGVPVAVWI